MNDQYNSRSIIAAAEAKLASSGIGAAQNVYQSALLDWVDDATMGDTVDLESVRGEVANLWLAYAGLNRRSNLSLDVFGDDFHWRGELQHRGSFWWNVAIASHDHDMHH
eukprot:scaffold559_cov190-Alexandrium_tamarense.AAC.69